MNRRLLKINKSLQKILMEYLIRKKKIPLPGFISIKEVCVANDMKSAKIFISVMHNTDCSNEIYASLEQERYFIQKAISRSLRTKFCPRLNFFVNYVSYTLSKEDENPDSVSPNTDTDTKNPDTSAKNPDSVSPNTDTKNRDTSAKNPDSVSSNTDTDN